MPNDDVKFLPQECASCAAMSRRGTQVFFPRKLFLIELHKPTSLKKRKEENNLIKRQSLQPFMVHYVQCGQPELIKVSLSQCLLERVEKSSQIEGETKN